MSRSPVLRVVFLLPGLLLPGLLVGVAPALAETPEICVAGPDFLVPEKKLKHLAAAVRGHGTIDILAVGSGTTVGQDGGGGNAFPHRMVEALRAELPGRQIHLTVRGSRGATAADMLQMILTAMAEEHFALVLWQTGTVEAVRAIPPEDLRQILDAGIVRIRNGGADLVLIGAQYSRTMAAKVNELPYLQVLREAADTSGVVLFRRYDLTRSWAAAGRRDLEDIGKADREAAIDALHACLADALARFVSHGAGIPIP